MIEEVKLLETCVILSEVESAARQSAVSDALAAMREAREVAIRKIMDGLWPILGGDMTSAEDWHEISNLVTTAIEQIEGDA